MSRVMKRRLIHSTGCPNPRPQIRAKLARGFRFPTDIAAMLLFVLCVTLSGELLTGCDVIVEAAYASPYGGTLYPTDAHPSPQLPAADDEVEVPPTDKPGESISYHQLVAIGVLYAVEHRPADGPKPHLAPGEWMELPIVPTVTTTARRIYQQGLRHGNDPHAFSKVGDCQNVPSLFLGVFDDPGAYRLRPEDLDLQATIDWYSGSFSRDSLAVRGGFNAASVLSPVWADVDACERDENPLECELRLHKPSVVIINLETWWEKSSESYELYLRTIIETTISYGVVPILSTKADNLEGDNSINATIADLAVEYDIPFWNFWRAAQSLPGDGLQDDGFHLTYAQNFFDDPDRMKTAWPWRNLTALQALDAVRRGLAATER
jgi:hypothetical protein